MVELFFVLLACGVLAIPVISILALSRTNSLNTEVAALRADLSALERRLNETGPAPSAPEPEPEPEIDVGQPVEPDIPPEFLDEPEEAAETPPSPEPAPQPAIAAKTADSGLEQRLTSRWMVWLGGATLALGSIFLVKYSIDAGLLGPAARVSLGGLLAVILIVGGEWLRRQPHQQAIVAIGPNYVPPAVTAAGIVAGFGSAFAAYGLYDLLPPVVAFILLALVATLAVGLSLLQGPFIAALGLVGAFAVPALVSTGNNSAWALFSYLTFVVAGGFGVVHYQRWWWLAWLVLAGGLGWAYLWMADIWQVGDTLPVAAYLVIFTGLAYLIRYDAPIGRQVPPWEIGNMAPQTAFAFGAGLLLALAFFGLVRNDGYGLGSLIVLAAFCIALLYQARREPSLEGLALVSALLAIAMLAAWHEPAFLDARKPLIIGQERVGLMPGPVIPPQMWTFAVTSACFAALFAVAGYIALWRSLRPAFWAAISGVPPILILIVAYARGGVFDTDIYWAIVSLVLGGIAVAAAAQTEKRRHEPGMEGAVGVYAIAIIAAVSLALPLVLEQAWLTVSLSLQLPALAWINNRLKVPLLRHVAVVLIAVVSVRLLINRHILDYAFGTVPNMNWVLYGYGLPAVAFYMAARWFRREKDDYLIVMLESGTLLFFVLLLMLQTRLLVGDGTLLRPSYNLFEQSLNTVAWAATAYGLLRQCRAETPRLVAFWGWRILAGLALAQVIVLQVGASNPLFTGDEVWGVPVLNLLFVAYGLPALFAMAFALEFRHQGMATLGRAAAGVAFLLVFVEITLEVRRVFHGPDLTLGPTSDAEWYAYSIVWLIYAGILLAAGILRGTPELRYGSLALVLFTVAKVFVWDMSALTGLYRALSFLGLGACLVGIGYLYQRFVFPPARKPPEKSEQTAPS